MKKKERLARLDEMLADMINEHDRLDNLHRLTRDGRDRKTLLEHEIDVMKLEISVLKQEIEYGLAE